MNSVYGPVIIYTCGLLLVCVILGLDSFGLLFRTRPKADRKPKTERGS